MNGGQFGLRDWQTVFSRCNSYKLITNSVRPLSDPSSSSIVCGNVKGLKQPEQLCLAKLTPGLWFRAPIAALTQDRRGTITELRACLPVI